MISSHSLSMSAQTHSSKSINGCSGSSFFGRLYGRLSLKKPIKVPSPPLLHRPLRESPFRGSTFDSVFRYFEENGDGKISASELCKCLQSVGEELSPADIEAFLKSWDVDGDDKMAYEDFLKLVEVEEDEKRERILKEAFAAFAMDGKGSITERSLRLALRRLGEEKSAEECRDMIKKFDLNGDGVICFEEFKLMML